ncbi:MAG: hypothetical protein WDO56_11950 [Gammaproteobacteria bacterium]
MKHGLLPANTTQTTMLPAGAREPLDVLVTVIQALAWMVALSLNVFEYLEEAPTSTAALALWCDVHP